MKAFDFIFLIIAIFLVAYLSLKMQELSSFQIVMILALVAFASFQFNLRRQMRKKMDNDPKNPDNKETGL